MNIERATSREKGQPLCMTQYYRLLTSYRAPGIPRDCIYSTLEQEEGETNPVSENVVVTCRNHFLTILTEAPNAQNRRNLDLIENAMLVVCLDDPLPASFNCRTLRSDVPEEVRGHIVNARDETNMAHQMIHGGGSAANSANRWFDVTVQIIISNDGVWGLCYEHSPSEGVAVVQLMEDVLKKCDSMPTSCSTIPTDNPCLQPPKRLDIVEDLDFYVYRFPGYGKEFIKSVKCSPDAYIQLALQLYRQLVATYESASTRRFLLGRVDCIRSAHVEALQWVRAMCQDESGTEDCEDEDTHSGKRVTFSLYDVQQKLQLFDAAMKKQTEVMVENILGQGIDIHLLGLREMAKDLGEPIPDLFQDDVYQIANHFSLSTSQVPTKSDSFMGYGPVVPDGYGASYNPHADTIVFCLSAFHSCETTSTWKFAHSLEESLCAMKNLLSNRQAKK
ncbi:Choline O-acetyltransferase [Blattella germanica]|nr:Choline O-acetyltransferase [Blattella germanica]